MVKTSKEISKQSWESIVNAWKHLKETIISGTNAIWDLLKWIYLAVDAWDKKIWEWIEKKLNKKWKMTKSKIWNFIKNNIVKILLWAWILTYWWTEIIEKWNDKQEDKIEIAEWSYIEKFWNDEKIFVIDVSANNKLNEKKFKEWNKELWEKEKEDTRWVSWIYIRIQSESGEDVDCKDFFKWIKEYNKSAEKWQQIAVWWYIYFNKATAAITDEWIEAQVDRAISILDTLNKEWDDIVDLIPMLDFEYSVKEWGDPWVNSEKWQRSKEAVLKRLKLFEEKTWIIPWIYTWWSIYHDYFLNDERFSKYPVWIATYNWKRVDQSEDWHSVKIWPANNPVEYQPHLVQFSDNIKKSWFWTEKWENLDGSSTTKDKFKELIIRNDDAPNDL